MNADSIKIECEEDGFHLIIDGDSPCEGYSASVVDYRIEDPEALYDHVRAAIEPWLMERDSAKREWLAAQKAERDHEDALDAAAFGYATSDPKHPDFHSVHADIWDAREGK